MDDLGRGGGLHHRLRIGQANVLGREDAQAPGDEQRVGAALDQASQPVERRIGVRVPQALDERRGAGSSVSTESSV